MIASVIQEGMATGAEIKAARERKGMSQQAVADAVGMSQPAYLAIEDGSTKRSRYMSDIERVLGLAEDRTPVIVHRPEPQFFGPKDLKVFAAAEGGPGEMVVGADPIDVVVRPWYLEHVPDGFAVLITGESMLPSFRPGDLAIVNPRLPPQRYEDMIFVAGEAVGEFRATIKHLLRWTATRWEVEQFNPPQGEPREFSLLRSEWPKAIRVVGSYRR